MIYELVGSRILAPFLGTSLATWTAIIGVILGSLSLGYYLGGKMADKDGTVFGLSRILFLSAVFIGLTFVLKNLVFFLFQDFVSYLKITSVISAVLIFAPASIMLGMVSPYAVKLKIDRLDTSGSTVGNLYALSTLGSIGGTFFAGFFLIPFFGSTNILFLLSFLLLLLSVAIFPRNDYLLRVALVAVLLLMYSYSSVVNRIHVENDQVRIETEYNTVDIFYSRYKDEKIIRELRLNNERSSAMYKDSDDLVYEYTKFYRLAEHFTPSINNVLMIGGAAYSYPKDFLKNYPEAKMDVVEIDPELTEIAKKYFSLSGDSRLTSYYEDGRLFLNSTQKKYDAILGDAFSSLYSIPFHLTTRETVQKKYNALTDNGVVIVNIISALEGEKSDFLRAEYHTYASVFPHVYLFPVRGTENTEIAQNIMLVALKSTTPPQMISSDPRLNSYLEHLYTKNIPDDLPLLTDEYAPVEYYANKIL